MVFLRWWQKYMVSEEAMGCSIVLLSYESETHKSCFWDGTIQTVRSVVRLKTRQQMQNLTWKEEQLHKQNMNHQKQILLNHSWEPTLRLKPAASRMFISCQHFQHLLKWQRLKWEHKKCQVTETESLNSQTMCHIKHTRLAYFNFGVKKKGN